MALRVLMLEFPLACFLAAYLTAVWTHRLHDLYLGPQMDAMMWNDARMDKESTYYKRYCSPEDQTTRSFSDLVLPVNASAEDAYEHQLTHGLTVFPSLLSDKTATKLRDYVTTRNYELSEEESIFVLSQKKRYSFALPTEEPTVQRAVMEIASDRRLKTTLEEILGPNPALIELSTITSTFGASQQMWHDDVLAKASTLQFGQAFGPSYCIFIQLQNTTKAMGATEVCPGTHVCVSGRKEAAFCDRTGFQAVGENGYWRAGDGMLMNMNTYHRGPVSIRDSVSCASYAHASLLITHIYL
jgi:hypothetical protein